MTKKKVATPKKKDSPLRLVRKETRNLPCKVNDEDKRRVSSQLAARYQDMKDLDVRQKSMKAAMTAEAKAIESEVNSLATILNTGIEYRMVEVEVRIGVEGKAIETRIDTGDILAVREARPEEQQLAFPEPETAGVEPETELDTIEEGADAQGSEDTPSEPASEVQ